MEGPPLTDAGLVALVEAWAALETLPVFDPHHLAVHCPVDHPGDFRGALSDPCTPAPGWPLHAPNCSDMSTCSSTMPPKCFAKEQGPGLLTWAVGSCQGSPRAAHRAWGAAG